MTINLTSRRFSLVINGVDRTGNMININLSQNELGSEGAFVTGEIELQANYNEVAEFTYLASPTIAENWARGASVVYQIANDSGTLVNHPFSGGALYILKEPAPPDANFRIKIPVGDQGALRNYRTADTDPSAVIAGVSTDRNTVIERYLAASGASYSIGSIPYPFSFPQPKTEGNSLISVAAQMARSAGHILYTNAAGTIVNKAINLAATAIATYRISEDEQLFDQVDSSGVETPVDQLVIAGIATTIDTASYPKTNVNVSYGSIVNQYANPPIYEVITQRYRFISKRTTITEYGWDGVQERIVTLSEASTIYIAFLKLLESDPAAFILPTKEVVTIKRYDARNRLIYELEEVNTFITNVQLFELQGFGLGFTFRLFDKPQFTTTKLDFKDVVTTYSYDETTDVLISKRTEEIFYSLFSNTGENVVFQRVAKVESWNNGFYDVQNFYQNNTLNFARISFRADNPRFEVIEGAWESGGGSSTYSTDGSTKAPATTYRKPFEPIETQVKATLKATPFAGQSFYSRSRPVDVPYLESQLQATEYGNTYLALLYGRKQGFVFGTAISNTLIASLTPLSRVDILWRGVRYKCLTDGASWTHNQTQCAIGMRLIVIGTALEADPPETIYPLVAASALIKISARLSGSIRIGIYQDPFVGGAARLSGRVNVFISEGVRVQAQFRFQGRVVVAITDDTAIGWLTMLEGQWRGMTQTQWRGVI
jgi:hypothetical protein